METAEHRTLDGSVVSFSGSMNLSEPASSIGVLQVQGSRHELTSTVKEEAVWFITDVLRNPAPNEAYSLQAGTLHVSHRNTIDPDSGLDVDIWAGAWEGELWSLYCHLYGGKENVPLLELFGGLTLVETTTGLVAEPGSANGVYDEAPIIVKRSPTVGLLSVEHLTNDVAAVLPDSPGTEVAGGELYFVGDSAPYFLLVGPTTLLTATVESDPDMTATALEDLIVAWTDPS